MSRQGVVDIISQLEADESTVLHAYRDSLGNWTIGTGHKIEAEDLQDHLTVASLVWTPEQAAAQLQRDLLTVNTDLQKNLPWVWDLGVVRRGVFQNMTFNMGIGRLMGFVNTLAAAKTGDWQRCHDEMLKSKWAIQVGKRADRLADQVVLNEWQ